MSETGKRTKNNKKNISKLIVSLLIILCIVGVIYIKQNMQNYNTQETKILFDISTIPKYSGEPYVEINNNIPYFTEDDYTHEPFERYSELDEKGRCRTAFANVCKEIMPPEGDIRGDISSVKPTGWVQNQYDGKYLYNRCHLVGYQLADEDANELNLITGTRYFNISGMLPFENMVAEYINKSNQNVHVLYRVTPIFEGDNLLASGVEIEAYSVEDRGKGICFNVYVYNVQPGINIDYKTGENWN